MRSPPEASRSAPRSAMAGTACERRQRRRCDNCRAARRSGREPAVGRTQVIVERVVVGRWRRASISSAATNPTVPRANSLRPAGLASPLVTSVQERLNKPGKQTRCRHDPAPSTATVPQRTNQRGPKTAEVTSSSDAVTPNPSAVPDTSSAAAPSNGRHNRRTRRAPLRQWQRPAQATAIVPHAQGRAQTRLPSLTAVQPLKPRVLSAGGKSNNHKGMRLRERKRPPRRLDRAATDTSRQDSWRKSSSYLSSPSVLAATTTYPTGRLRTTPDSLSSARLGATTRPAFKTIVTSRSSGTRHTDAMSTDET